MGLHLASVHVPANERLNNTNPGIYLRHEAGWTAGVYYNSLKRTSVYGGYTFTTRAISPKLPLSLTVGAITGYQRRKETFACKHGEDRGRTGSRCSRTVGFSSGPVTAMAAPSVAFPTLELATGFLPRLSYVPSVGVGNEFNVLHLSVERAFR
ncbi:MAG: hypothetical protein ABI433_13385 [Burkholderiaceae bacterium]